MFNLTYFQIDRLSSNIRGDSLLNHISSIFGKSVQGEPANVIADAGSVVEVAQEVYPDNLQLPVPDRQVSADVPRQVQRVLVPCDAQADAVQLASGVSHVAARVQDAPRPWWCPSCCSATCSGCSPSSSSRCSRQISRPEFCLSEIYC